MEERIKNKFNLDFRTECRSNYITSSNRRHGRMVDDYIEGVRKIHLATIEDDIIMDEMNISIVKGNIKRRLKMLSVTISVPVRVGY